MIPLRHGVGEGNESSCENNISISSSFATHLCYKVAMNQMVANPNKFQFMFLGTREKTKLCFNIGKTTYSKQLWTTIRVGINVLSWH